MNQIKRYFTFVNVLHYANANIRVNLNYTMYSSLSIYQSLGRAFNQRGFLLGNGYFYRLESRRVFNI